MTRHPGCDFKPNKSNTPSSLLEEPRCPTQAACYNAINLAEPAVSV